MSGETSLQTSFLLGAGFSEPFDIPTMGPFYERFVEETKKRYPSLESDLDRAIGKIRTEPDLEALLSVLNAAIAAESGLPEELIDERIEEWMAHAEALRSHLQSYIVERCESFNGDKAADLCLPLVRGLARGGTVVFTTNYDRVLEHACASAGIDLADGFKRGGDQTDNLWCADFEGELAMAKLHGSVTWYQDPSRVGEFLRFDRGYALPGSEYHLSKAGRELRPLMIIPTLEKQVLTHPYAYLSHFFADRLARTSLLVVMGSSLRDEHLTAAISYHADKLVVLVVGKGSDAAAGRLQGNHVIALEASTDDFLVTCTAQLLDLVQNVGAVTSTNEVVEVVDEFAGDQRRLLSELGGLGDEERRNVELLRGGEPLVALRALTRLRGKSDDALIAATITLLRADNADLRCSAAGNLGTVASTEAIPHLKDLALNDAVGFVRIEAALALNEIGTSEARAALSEYMTRNGEDSLENLM